ncbi:hypothetical protein [Deinococcus sp. ME38]|uniref:hypothetical protein n=1 Tax=Deinococcus sp. ME38 TaxID=3400344 RepID=UPI003B59DE30
MIVDVVQSVHIGNVSYVLRSTDPGIHGTDNVITKYEIIALRTQDSKKIWQAYVAPYAKDLRVIESVIFANSCFDGAALVCRVEAFNIKSGVSLWKAEGIWITSNTKHIVLFDNSFLRQDEDGANIEKYRIVSVSNGTKKEFLIRIKSRTSCGNDAKLEKFISYSMTGVAAKITDGCGSFIVRSQ